MIHLQIQFPDCSGSSLTFPAIQHVLDIRTRRIVWQAGLCCLASMCKLISETFLILMCWKHLSYDTHNRDQLGLQVRKDRALSSNDVRGLHWICTPCITSPYCENILMPRPPPFCGKLYSRNYSTLSLLASVVNIDMSIQTCGCQNYWNCPAWNRIAHHVPSIQTILMQTCSLLTWQMLQTQRVCYDQQVW